MTQEKRLMSWVAKQIGHPPEYEALRQDAGFRHYFRLAHPSLIAVDSPCEHIDNPQFMKVLELMGAHGVRVPTVHSYDGKDFFLIEDLGDIQLQQVLNDESVDGHYRSLMPVIQAIQTIPQSLWHHFPAFDERFVRFELSLFSDWCLTQLLNHPVDTKVLKPLYDCLVDAVTSQPQGVLHRDFHCRNIMITQGDYGIIDSQDAMIGPISYDLMSLVKDCYLRWPQEKTHDWISTFAELVQVNHPTLEVKAFIRLAELTGLQRHLKVLGVFSRLNLRDQKPSYLKDTPRIMAYVMDVIHRYPELEFARPFFDNLQKAFHQFWVEQGISKVA